MLIRSPADGFSLPPPLESELGLVHQWLVKIARGENPEFDLRNLRAVLLNARKMVKADASINEAVDEARPPWPTRGNSLMPPRQARAAPIISSSRALPG